MIRNKKLYAVGIGPGAYEQMTIQAVTCLKESRMIIGYTVYIDLIREYFPEKEMRATPMMQEVARCRMALEEADRGGTLSLVCSGDSGIYGMAGLLLELAGEYPEVTVEVIPGVTAACGGAAILGAPICHDFAVISLSDLLTPMELIRQRVEGAAKANMVICLYNPSSKKRSDYLQQACDLILLHQSPQTICGIARNIGREEQTAQVLTLQELRDTQVDMFTTVYIGNSFTKEEGGKMITPRGYQYV